MDELLEKYNETFGEPFPLMSVLGMNDNDIRETIKDCLASNKVFVPDVPKDALI